MADLAALAALLLVCPKAVAVTGCGLEGDVQCLSSLAEPSCDHVEAANLRRHDRQGHRVGCGAAAVVGCSWRTSASDSGYKALLLIHCLKGILLLMLLLLLMGHSLDKLQRRSYGDCLDTG